MEAGYWALQESFIGRAIFFLHDDSIDRLCRHLGEV